MIIAGVDEAGRGALAGPVVAGAVILPASNTTLFRDSKMLSAAQREKLYEIILKECDWGIGIVSAREIDTWGIKKATHRAMKKALEKLQKKPEKILVDGCDHFSFEIPSQEIIGGDKIHPCISAASILAKVTRDHQMQKEALKYPDFHFAQNKGYGCPKHLKLLSEEKYCPLHRKTYNPLSLYLRQYRLF